MTIQEHITHHEDNINRIYEERDKLQEHIHKASGDDRKITLEDLFYFTKQLSTIDKDLRASIDTRMTLLNIKG